MSIIGPRPWIPEYYKRFNSYQKRRVSVLPGIIGLAQVNGRNNIDIFKKISYDIMYVDNIVNKKILDYCPNYYKILAFEPYEDDKVSSKLIKLYRNYIFNIDVNNRDDVESVQELDRVLNKYIEDYLFRKEMQKQVLTIKVQHNATNVVKEIIKSLIKIFYNYEEYTTRVIYISKWI